MSLEAEVAVTPRLSAVSSLPYLVSESSEVLSLQEAQLAQSIRTKGTDFSGRLLWLFPVPCASAWEFMSSPRASPSAGCGAGMNSVWVMSQWPASGLQGYLALQLQVDLGMQEMAVSCLQWHSCNSLHRC